MGKAARIPHGLGQPGAFATQRVLATENRILRAQLPKRVRLSDAERSTLAEIGKRRGRKVLKQFACVAQPDTILGWYRRLIAQKFDGSKFRAYPGRPAMDRDVTELIVQMVRENPSWECDRIVGALANLGHSVSDQTVGNIPRQYGLAPAPSPCQHFHREEIGTGQYRQMRGDKILPSGVRAPIVFFDQVSGSDVWSFDSLRQQPPPRFPSGSNLRGSTMRRLRSVVAMMFFAVCLRSQTRGCEALPAAKPEDITLLANTGIELSHAKQYDAAATCYRKVLAIDPNVREIQLNLGLAEFKSGRFRSAAELFQAVLKHDPQNMQARTLLGMSFYGGRMFREAAANLEIVLAADPENPRLHYYLAQSLLSSSEYKRSREEFEWLERHDPDAAPTHVLMAEALDGLARPEEAILELKTAIAKSPNEPHVHFAIGYIYWSQQKDDEAAREFRLELDRDPGNAQAWAWLADVLIRNNDFQKAKPLLDKALSIDPRVRIAHLDLGIVFAQDKKYDRAIAALKEAIRLDASKTDAHFRLARVYREAGKPAEATAELAIVRQLGEQKKKDSLHEVTGQTPGLEPDK